MKHRRSAFTLVELLVVIGIIALLISILLPSLNKARSQAMVVQCSSNMRQIAILTTNYAGDNKGALPIRDQYWKNNSPSQGRFQYKYPSYAYNIRSNGSYNPDTCSNLGLFYARGYVKSGKALYCPVAHDDPTFGWDYMGSVVQTDGVQQPWPLAKDNRDASSWQYRSSYSYNPYFSMVVIPDYGTPPGVPTAAKEMAFPKLSKYPKSKFLAVDLINDKTSKPHFAGSSHPSWNCLYSDGHVASAVSKVVSDAMTITGVNANQNWTAFETYRDALEAAANGYPVNTNEVYSGTNLITRVQHAAGANLTDIDAIPGGQPLFHPY